MFEILNAHERINVHARNTWGALDYVISTLDIYVEPTFYIRRFSV